MNVIKRLATIGVVLMVTYVVAGCGYGFVNVKKQLPPDIKKVYIPAFNNQSDEASLGVLMTNALVRQFMKSGALTPTKKEDADAELIGSIDSVDYFNRVYDVEDRAVLVTLTVHARAKLVKGDVVIWEVSDLTYAEDYNIGGGPVVLDSDKEIALEDISEKLAAEFHDLLVFGY